MKLHSVSLSILSQENIWEGTPSTALLEDS
jgi:hypothetical protein